MIEIDAILEWISNRGAVVIYALLAFSIMLILVRILGRGIEIFLDHRARANDSDDELLKRARTLTRVIRNFMIALFGLILFVYLLTELGVDLGPILVGAGVVGVALGLGAQKLVQDYLNGFFILIENQYRVGDVINIANTDGLVEGIGFRTTILRDFNGVVHTIPNSQVTTVSNMTMGYSRYLLDVGVAYKEDVDRVMAVLLEVGQELQSESKLGEDLIEPVEVMGLQKFDDSAIVIRIRFTSRPGRQWDLARELRRLIKNKFDELNIEIPFPHRTLYFGQPVEEWISESATANGGSR